MEQTKRIAVLLMGGKGERFNCEKPKQYIEMGGQPLFLYANNALERSPFIDEIIYVCPTGFVEYTKNYLSPLPSHVKPSHFISGGSTRQDSTTFALEYLKDNKIAKNDDIVLILDSDRPNLTPRLIIKNLDNAKQYGASATAVKSRDTIGIMEDNGFITGFIPRKKVLRMQTPQAFKFGLLYEAELKARNEHKLYTDECSLVLDMCKHHSVFVEGDYSNIKITTKEDAAHFFKGYKTCKEK